MRLRLDLFGRTLKLSVVRAKSKQPSPETGGLISDMPQPMGLYADPDMVSDPLGFHMPTRAQQEDR
jgi:hypothetical protein